MVCAFVKQVSLVPFAPKLSALITVADTVIAISLTAAAYVHLDGEVYHVKTGKKLT